MAFETETELLFKMYVREVKRQYVEYGKDFVRFRGEGGKLYEIKCREIKEREVTKTKENMEEFDRTFLKEDEVMNQLFELLKRNHKVARHTEKVLIENRHIKDFCEEARHFVLLPSENPIYLHYDVSSWFKKPSGVQVKIESVGIYDDFMEYEVARLKGLHGTKESDIPNIN